MLRTIWAYLAMKKFKLSTENTIPEAINAILLSLFATIRKNKNDVLNRRDTESLHDYRVAIRRTRCLLSQFKQVFHKQAIGHFRAEFFWLFGATSKVRDMDVHLENLQYYKTLLPATTENDLFLLNQHLLAEQAMAYDEMVKVLGSGRYQKLLTDWSVFLYTPKTMKAQFANRPIGHFADKRIRLNYLAILKQGQSITLDTPDEIFHDLRKRCKKLRYLLEFFGEFYPDENTEKLLNSLKRLQDNLGAHQDLCVQIQFLQQLPPAKQAAWQLLVEVLQNQKQQLRAEFKTHFDGFTKIRMPSLNN